MQHCRASTRRDIFALFRDDAPAPVRLGDMQLPCTGCTHTLRSSVRTGRDRTRYVRLAGPRKRSFYLRPCFFGERARVPAGLFGLRSCSRDADKRGTILFSTRPGGKSRSAKRYWGHDGSRDRKAYFRPVSVAVARALVRKLVLGRLVVSLAPKREGKRSSR